MAERRKLASDLAKARMDRIKGGGVNGAQASSIGLTLVGCIIAGAGAGWWLDNRFGTQGWTPILFLVGVAAGFRQMMLTIRDTNKWEARRKAEEKAERAANTSSAGESSVTEGFGNVEAEPQTERIRPRVFQVPPPPSASFDAKPQSIEYPIDQTDAEMDERTLTEKLLDESPDEESQDSERPQSRNAPGRND
jgi:F0F1-type ATP synthase assembly protein I